MAETLEPIAPPIKVTGVPVPTVTVAPVTPAPGTKAGLSSAYRQAAETGDPNKMLDFAKSAQGTDFERPAMEAWRGMANRTAMFDEIANAVDKKGGPQSPDGKLELVNQWPKTQNEPSVVRAVIEHLLGNKNARFFVSEGMIKPKIVMDRHGMPLQQNWTESGRLVNVLDPVSGKEISPEEYGKRSGGVESITETLPYIASKEKLRMNQESANKAQAATNDLAAASQQLGVYHNQASSMMDELFKSLKDQDLLSPDERQQLASFATRGVQSGASSSQAAAALDQYVRGGTASLSQEQRKTLDASLKKFGMSIGPTGTIVDNEGKTVSESKLNNLQTSGSFGKEFNQSFQQSRDEAMNSLILKKLNSQQQQMFGQILDLNKQIEQKRIEMAEKHGANANLPFLMNPILPNVGDQYARYQVQQLVGVRNAELSQKYADYRAGILKNYPPGTSPDPGEIEKGFSRTKEYLQFQDETQGMVRNLMNTINKTKPTGVKIAKEPIAGEVPGAEIQRTQPAVPPVSSAKPTENVQGAVAPPVPTINKQPEGFKVERPNRQFKVKE